MSGNNYTILEHLFYSITLILWVAAVAMLFAGIWSDQRWAITGVVCFCLGFVTGSIPGWVRK